MPYEVSTSVFEGPFDLLLHLITKEQVDLYEISISRIVDAYLVSIEQFRSFDLDVATEFLLIAATLIELKTRRLLPGRDDIDLDEELALWEERDMLLARLLECKTFKDAAESLQRLADRSERSQPRRAGLEDRFLELMPDLLAGVVADDIRAAFIRACTPKPVARVDIEHLAPIGLSVREAVDELISELPLVGVITFRHLTQALGTRIEVIVRFLAVLELYKEGMVDLDQGAAFGDLTITWLGGEEGAVLDPIAIEEYAG